MSPPNGIYCPVCWSKKLKTTGRRSPLPGLRYLYRRCRTCDHTFKVEERLIFPECAPDVRSAAPKRP